MSPRNFLAELKRRNVVRTAILYLGAVWTLAQGISQLGPSLGAPERATRWFLVAAAIGFPFWIAFASFYEFTGCMGGASEMTDLEKMLKKSGSRTSNRSKRIF